MGGISSPFDYFCLYSNRCRLIITIIDQAIYEHYFRAFAPTPCIPQINSNFNPLPVVYNRVSDKKKINVYKNGCNKITIISTPPV